MSVKNQHKDHKAMLGKWGRCKDVCSGQDAVHAAGEAYLPKLKDQSDQEYKNYLQRTTFYNATWRTLVGLQGMLFRKPPEVDVPEKVTPMLDNITLSGTPLHVFTLELAEECLKLGRVGVFVDFPTVPEDATAADAETGKYRPSMQLRDALGIINWKTENINNETVLSMVVLKECADVYVDEFTNEERVQYRVLDLTNALSEDGSSKKIYRVRVFTVEDVSGKPVDTLIDGPHYPKIDGKNLESIPFQFIGVDDVSWTVDEPPLIDLVDINLSHYRTTADYEHGCHFTGLPTPVISGFVPEIGEDAQGAGPEKAQFYIGSTTAWVFPRPDAKASFLEFTGQGLESLEKNLAKKENYMAILGARMLEVQVRGVESANTAAIHRSGEQSMLSSVAQAISIGFTKILKVFCQFADPSTDLEEVKFELNRDFFPVPMDALTITAIIAAWQNGAISYDTMFDNLKAGEIISLDSTVESEQKKIKENPAPVIDAPTTPGNVKKEGPKTKAAPATPAPTITQLQNGK